jgi:hypothetical protein
MAQEQAEKSKEVGAALSQPSCLLLMMFIKGKINHRDTIKLMANTHWY